MGFFTNLVRVNSKGYCGIIKGEISGNEWAFINIENEKVIMWRNHAADVEIKASDVVSCTVDKRFVKIENGDQNSMYVNHYTVIFKDNGVALLQLVHSGLSGIFPYKRTDRINKLFKILNIDIVEQ